jgi:hypothetical protein
MRARALQRLTVQAFDVGIELPAVNSPHPPPSDLYRWKLAGTHERIDLRNADIEISGDVLEPEQARLDTRGLGALAAWAALRNHCITVASPRTGTLSLCALPSRCGSSPSICE